MWRRIWGRCGAGCPMRECAGAWRATPRTCSRMRSFPFAADVYFSLFETYNSAIWPAQLVAYGLGILALVVALRPLAAGGRIALAFLSIFWLWNGIAYPLLHCLQINFAAPGFAALFVLQGVLFAGYAVGGRSIFRFRTDVFGWSGFLLCLFALAVYPLLGWLAGHGWARAGVFGVEAAATTIVTFGKIMMAEGVYAVEQLHDNGALDDGTS